AVAAAEGRERGAASRHDRRDGEQRVDIVDDGRLAEQTRLGRKRRPRARHRAAALERLQQRRLLAQHEAARAAANLDLEREAGAEDARSDAPPLPGMTERRG